MYIEKLNKEIVVKVVKQKFPIKIVLETEKDAYNFTTILREAISSFTKNIKENQRYYDYAIDMLAYPTEEMGFATKLLRELS